MGLPVDLKFLEVGVPECFFFLLHPFELYFELDSFDFHVFLLLLKLLVEDAGLVSLVSGFNLHETFGKAVQVSY